MRLLFACCLLAACAQDPKQLDARAPDDTSCASDDDCIAVDAAGCCPDGHEVAVNANATDEYATSAACTTAPVDCPTHVVLETRVAQCNAGTHTCEMIQPEDIHCGGFVPNPHACPTDYVCSLGNVPGVAGACIAQQR